MIKQDGSSFKTGKNCAQHLMPCSHAKQSRNHTCAEHGILSFSGAVWYPDTVDSLGIHFFFTQGYVLVRLPDNNVLCPDSVLYHIRVFCIVLKPLSKLPCSRQQKLLICCLSSKAIQIPKWCMPLGRNKIKDGGLSALEKRFGVLKSHNWDKQFCFWG